MDSARSAPSRCPPRRRGYRELVGIMTVQLFGNQMAGSFWLVYLVSTPQSLNFDTAVLVYLISFGAAAVTVLAIARGFPIRASTSMTAGVVIMMVGHFAFALLPPIGALVVGGAAFGLYIPFFWLPMNTLIVRDTTFANRASRLAGVTATFTTVAVVAPALGGYLAELLGYRVVFAFGGLIQVANLLLVRWLAQVDEAIAFSIDLRRVGRRTALAFSGQGGVDGLLSVATPLGSFLFTTDSLALGLLFALFSLAAGVATVVLGRVSDRVPARTPFLLFGPILSVPACLLAFGVRDLGTFAFAIGWLSMTSAVAPSFIYTILADRAESTIPNVTATREFLLNSSRSLALLGGIIALLLGADVYALYLLVGGVILLEALAN